MSSENLIGNGSACDTAKALLIKRLNIYKRDRCGLVCEVFVPVIVFIFGMLLLKISSSPAPVISTLGTDVFPSTQNVLVNSNPVVSEGNYYSMADITANFPDSNSYFDF